MNLNITCLETWQAVKDSSNVVYFSNLPLIPNVRLSEHQTRCTTLGCYRIIHGGRQTQNLKHYSEVSFYNGIITQIFVFAYPMLFRMFPDSSTTYWWQCFQGLKPLCFNNDVGYQRAKGPSRPHYAEVHNWKQSAFPPFSFLICRKDMQLERLLQDQQVAPCFLLPLQSPGFTHK